MRLGMGLAVLGIGVLALGWWARVEYAGTMQAMVLADARTVAATSVHGVTVTVTGRDIAVSGLADGPAERDRLLAALDSVRGRRVVEDALQVLPVADPYLIQIEWRDGALAARGTAPTGTAQAMFAALGLGELPLAAGAPDALWPVAAASGLAGLRLLDSGQVELSGQHLRLAGVARTPVEGEAARAALVENFPQGYDAVLELAYLDDGTPPAYALHYAAGTGPRLQGKLPPGVSADDVALALGLETLDNAADVALMGEEGQVSPVMAALRPWLPEVETLDVAVDPDGTLVDAGFGAGADLDLLSAALGADLAGAEGVTLRVRVVEPEEAEGTRRSNLLAGRDEVLQGGYWLPALDFAPAPGTCAAETDRALAANTIGFVTGSARLDARARGAVNALAGVLGLCLRAGLRAEIGGHTDATGGDEANLALSEARAEAVRAALIARGVPEAGLSAAGYGAAEPIADNETEEGRAANRRTAVRWID